MLVIFVLSVFTMVACNPAPADNYKDQYCTDPRTMRRHAAYTEWADAYSCSRHRCQPGGRNLAIYTVGCKRVEAPESAIECEEVVEDTNMQFPFCCTRLRCLVVVRGEVWTRVLGQPWENLPAAPWSHMYKMKKPPPGDTTFLPKNPEQGPVYELTESETEGRDKIMRTSKNEAREQTTPTECPDCTEIVQRAAVIPPPASPDIVIALTSNDAKEDHPLDGRHKRKMSASPTIPYYEEEREKEPEVQEVEEITISPEKPVEQISEEKNFINSVTQTQKPSKGFQHRWNEDASVDKVKEDLPTADVPEEHDEKKDEKPSNLQSLVDAIGTRMRDIENVVQRMSEKVQHTKPEDEFASSDKSRLEDTPRKHHKAESKERERGKNKKNMADPDYKRFSVRNRGSKYLRAGEYSTEPSLFLEENNGYYTDAASTLLRRNGGPKEPVQMYVAPVDTRRKHGHINDSGDESEKKRKKHHKRKKSKHGHKKHHKDDKKKKFNTLASIEVEKNIVSLEDSSAITK